MDLTLVNLSFLIFQMFFLWENVIYIYFFQRFEDKYKTELETGQVSKHTQFNYAWSLIRSPDTNDIKKGAHLLQGTCTIKC